MRCAIAGCNADNEAKAFTGQFMFFRFPKDVNLIKQWENACKRADKFNVQTARVCSQHFSVESYERNLKYELLGYSAKNHRLLKPDSIPTLNLPKQKLKVKCGKARSERVNRRNRSKIVGEMLQNSIGDVSGGNSIESHGNNSLLRVENQNLEVGMSNNTVELAFTKRDIGVGTDNSNNEENVAQLKQEIERLKYENKIFHNFFSPAQIRKLKGPKTKVTWTVEDISKAIVIHSAGARAYRLLLKKGYPLPAVSTLRSWCKKIQLEPGILKKVFMIVKRTDLTKLQRVCVLSFDEVKVRSQYLYDKANDATLRPYNYVQVAYLRGLFGNWKQPIFYDFDCAMKKEQLFEIIKYVESAGFPVAAIISDLGGGNRGLYRSLDITISQTWFINPVSNEKVYVFADVPHLIKLLRNHFVDDGFILDKGIEVNKSVIEKIIQLTGSTDLSIAHKISANTLNVKGAQRQKVKFATKLFSHMVSKAITRCGMLGYLDGYNWLECAEFFKDVNDWFDCFNVRVPKPDSRERKQAYGLCLETQNAILDKMSCIITSLRSKGRKSMLPFQRGILISNTSLKLLYEDLKAQYGIKYILTYRVNQDVLENFFGTIRAKGGLHDHPTPLEFKYRLRSYILGRNDQSLSDAGNTEPDDTPNMQPLPEKLLSSECLAPLTSEGIEMDTAAGDELAEEIDSLVYDGLEYLAGFICYKLRNTEPMTSTSNQESFTWVDHVSEGGLTKPSEEMMKNMEELEKIFNHVNSDELFICKGYLKHLIEQASKVNCSEQIKKLFFRSRMYFRMKNLNKNLQERALSRKRKMLKTVS